MLIHLYAVHAWSEDAKGDAESPRANGHANGHPNGYARVDRRTQDAEEFELEGLDSEDEDDEALRHKENRPLAAHR